MPIYEYECGDCGNVFEEMLRRRDPDPEKCPSCGAGDINRLISSTNFKLKGSGWYVTDYSSDSRPSAGDTAPDKGVDSSSSSDDSSSSTSSSDDSSSSTSSSDDSSSSSSSKSDSDSNAA